MNREMIYVGDGKTEDGVRIVFQAFSDFLLLQTRLSKSSTPTTDPELADWLANDASWGIVEAAATTLPEKYGIELPDLLKFKQSDLDWRKPLKTEKARRRAGAARHAFRSVIETMPYRDPKAITPRTIELLNASLGDIMPNELFDMFFMIAPQPENPLNADGSHNYLKKIPMPARDQFFGFATYHSFFEERGAISRLARWAADGPYPSYDPEVVELAVIPLVWLFSSPNRYMRDWVTKALVELLLGHLDIALRILNRFWDGDDPYVRQRVVVVAYGALMRSSQADRDRAKPLAKRVLKLVFDPPVAPDEILLDAARGTVEFGVARKLLPAAALGKVRRPYGISPPASVRSKDFIEAEYGKDFSKPATASYSTVYSSIFSMGDFGRYVIESAMHHFKCHRIGTVVPDDDRSPRLVNARWKRFVGSLTDQQRERLVSVLDNPEASRYLHPWSLRRSADLELGDDQWNLLDGVWKYPKRRDDGFSSDFARRWVFMRTLSLGWSPSRFGQEDRSLGYREYDRTEHKAERWGKKYQWMAYHELLARVADNYQSQVRFSDVVPYEGLHQITAEREIDPTLPPIEYRALEEGRGESAPTWRKPPIELKRWPIGRLDFRAYGDDIKAFVDDEESEPRLKSLHRVTDIAGHEWIVLEGNLTQSDPSSAKRWRGLQQNLAIDSWFVPIGEAEDFARNASNIRKRHGHSLIDDHGHVDCCYAGEVGWSQHACGGFHRSLELYEDDNKAWNIVATTERYSWEGSLLDCSIGETVTATMPSSFIEARVPLVLEAAGPCWTDGQETVFTDYGRHGLFETHAFLVSSERLRQFLQANDVEVVLSTWFERRRLDDRHNVRHPYVDGYEAARLDSNLKLEGLQATQDSRQLNDIRCPPRSR